MLTADKGIAGAVGVDQLLLWESNDGEQQDLRTNPTERLSVSARCDMPHCAWILAGPTPGVLNPERSLSQGAAG